VQSVQNYQTEKHVHENEHDGRYTCDEIQCQNIDNQDERNYSQNTHMEKTENSIYDYYRDAKKENKDIQKYAKNDKQEAVETNNQMEIDLQEQE
jgi:hypothetical protein